MNSDRSYACFLWTLNRAVCNIQIIGFLLVFSSIRHLRKLEEFVNLIDPHKLNQHHKTFRSVSSGMIQIRKNPKTWPKREHMKQRRSTYTL